MKDNLLLGIKKNNFTFQVFIHNVFYAPSFYIVQDNKKFELEFRNKRVYTRAYYKNTTFNGSVMSHKTWEFCLKGKGCIILNKNDSLKLAGMQKKKTTQASNIETKWNFDHSLNAKQQKFFESILAMNKTLLSEIENIDLFKEQLKNNVSSSIYNEEDEIDEDSNFEKEYIKDCKEYINNFIQSEKDKENIDNLVTLENIIQVYPDLKKINKHSLKQYFKRFNKEYDIESFFAKSLFEFDESIYYDRELSLQNIGSTIHTYHLEYLKDKFDNGLHSKIKRILGKQFYKVKNADSIFGKVHLDFIFDAPSDEELTESVHKHFNKLIEFNNTFEKCINEYGTNEIFIELDDDKEKRFDNYEQLKTGLSDTEIKEYECVYKIVKPYYKSCLFKKNSSKLKPTVQNINSFIEYVNEVYKILIGNNYLVEVDKDTFTHNTSVNYDAIIKQLKAID